MVYNINEYNNGFKVFDTPAKTQQERVIVDKIMTLINNNKFDNLEEFISRNDSYDKFLKNNNMTNVVKHFGNTLSEEDYKRILESLKKLTNTKEDFEKDNIKTTNIDENEYNSFKGESKTYFLDNSVSDKKLEDQMKDLQPTQADFQTSDMKQNTENMFKELEKSKKESLNLSYLKEINKENLNEEEFALFNAAINYQLSVSNLIRVDLEKGVIVDENDKIMKIEKENGEYIIKGEENKIEETLENKKKPMQKQFTMNNNSIYSNVA